MNLFGGPKVKLFRNNVDRRCDEIVIDPIDYICQKHQIPIGTGIPDGAEINLHYRLVHNPKKTNAFSGIYIDDYPPAYNRSGYRHFMFLLKSYDFFVVSNSRVGDYLTRHAGKKPVIHYPGICGKEYYVDKEALKPRSFQQEKRMAVINFGSYLFDVRDLCHKGWKMLYFYPKNKHINNSLWQPYSNIMKYYTSLSEFSPDIIIQPWIFQEGFYYKTDLKMRESYALNSCLVSQDIGNIYYIRNGENGFVWKSLQEFHILLDNINIDEFRKIGLSHKDNDVQILRNLYDDLITLYRKKRR